MQPVLLSRYHPLDIFRFAQSRQAAGERVVFIVIEAVSGASVRPVGTPMAVSESGDYAGYVSNGCVDADIAARALDGLSDGKLRRVRYGEGSPYMDIQLPCGGGVSLVILPVPDTQSVSEICRRLDARESVRLDFSEGLSFGDGIRYAPPLRIFAAGRGENLIMFTRAAQSLGLDCIAYSPEPRDVSHINSFGGSAHTLIFGQAPDWQLDPRAAVVTLFHSHEYEAPLLTSALQSEAFYIGAMGSRRTHEQRLDALSQLQSTQQLELDLSRLRGPIGLVPSMRDAGRLAVSVLAEIIAQEGTPF